MPFSLKLWTNHNESFTCMEDPQCVTILLKSEGLFIGNEYKTIVRLTLSIDCINLSCFLQAPSGQRVSPVLFRVWAPGLNIQKALNKHLLNEWMKLGLSQLQWKALQSDWEENKEAWSLTFVDGGARKSMRIEVRRLFPPTQTRVKHMKCTTDPTWSFLKPISGT